MTKRPDGKHLSALMARAQSGDKRAYHDLLTAAAPLLRSYVYKRLSNDQVVEDVVQNILMAIHQSRHTYLPDKPFMPWMYGIAHYKLMDSLRKQYRKNDNETAQSEIVETFGSVDAKDDHVHATQDLEKAFDVLSKKQRLIVTRAKIEGMSIRDIADETGMSESAVKVTIHRALKKMKDRLTA